MTDIFENPEILVGRTINEYTFLKYISKGKIGAVYKALRKDIGDTVACKIIPTKNLKEGWQVEMAKAAKLQGIAEVVQYRYHFAEYIGSIPHAFILWEYVDGSNLREYCRAHPTEITMDFVKNLAVQVLRAFYAMDKVQVTHGIFTKATY